MSTAVSGVALRAMTPADVPVVLAAQQPGAVIGLAKVFPQDEFPFPREAVAQRWIEEIDTRDIDCLVIEQDEVVIGFAAIRVDEFLHFGIALEHWGTGAAQAAHDAIIDRMRAAKVTRAWLRVFTGNERGRRFYERLGWEWTGERSRSAFPPHPELLRYELDLDLRLSRLKDGDSFSQVIKKYLPAVESRAGDLLSALDENHVAEGTVDSIEQVVRERRESPVREPEW